MPYGYRGLKIFTSLSLRFQDFQRRKRNASGAVYDDPRVAVGTGRFDEVGAAAEAVRLAW